MVYREKKSKMDDWGVPLFEETHKYKNVKQIRFTVLVGYKMLFLLCFLKFSLSCVCLNGWRMLQGFFLRIPNRCNRGGNLGLHLLFSTGSKMFQMCCEILLKSDTLGDYVHIWRFPIAIPQEYPFTDGTFPWHKPSIHRGYPHDHGNPHICGIRMLVKHG